MPLTKIGPPEDCARHIAELLTGPEPAFLGRLGGIDTNAAVFTQGLEPSHERFRVEKRNLEVYTGYYDGRDDAELVPRFIELLTDSYRASRTLTAGHTYLIKAFFPEFPEAAEVPQEIIARVEAWVRDVVGRDREGRDREMNIIAYNFIERLTWGGPSLMSVFSEILPGKRVLVISPFEETIWEQYPKRHQFFQNYDYPEFHLSTYNTPLTYAGLPSQFFPDQDWFATLDRMKEDLRGREFDIALLCCASYATPLGAYIQDSLGKKAVYFGGILQIFLGIMGRRFNTPFFDMQINRGVYIHPLEAKRFEEQVKQWSDKPTEAFGAYF